MKLTELQLAVQVQGYERVFTGPFHGGCLGHGRSVAKSGGDAKYRTCRMQACLGSMPSHAGKIPHRMG